MDMIEVTVSALSDNTSPDLYTIVLSEKDGPRVLLITIGTAEARGLALAYQGESPRPMTHKVMADIISATESKLKEVAIHSVESNVYHCSIILTNNGNRIEVDCRPSDGLSLSLHAGCPVYVEESLLTDPEDQPAIRMRLSDYSREELEKLLASSIDREDYEQAARIRKTLDERS